MFGDDVINGKVGTAFAAVLTGVIIAPENFSSDRFEPKTGTANHPAQSNHGWQGIDLCAGMDDAPAVDHQGGLITNDQTDSPANITDIDWLKITIEHQNLL